MRRAPGRIVWRGAILLAASPGCIGAIDGAGGEPGAPPATAGSTPGGARSTPGSAGSAPVGAGAAAAPGAAEAPGAGSSLTAPMPLRRLTRLELANTLAQLLGVAVQVPDELPPDVSADSGFFVGGNVSRVEAQILMDFAGQLAREAVKDLRRLLPCDGIPAARTDQDACAQQLIVRFGRRAFRRPLAPAEVDDLFAHYRDRLRSELALDFVSAIRGLVQLMLQSPRFLYRFERGPGEVVARAGRIPFDAHEMASRLSYSLWASMPDEALFAAADRGQLATPDQVEQHARRMLADPRSASALEDFHLQWLAIGDVSKMEKDPRRYSFSGELGRAMMAETKRVATWIFQNDGRLETLLTSSESFIDSASLAKLYGYGGVVGKAATPVKLDPGQRAGLLTHAGFLTAHAVHSELNAIKRGQVVMEQLLCTKIPSPPAEMIPEPRPAAANLSTRERLAEHGENACARACHGLFDPPGLAFEHYDGIGAFRTMDGGKPVDASGAIRFPSGETRTVANALELTRALARSQDVRDCLARQWLRFLLRRKETPGDEAAVRAAQQRLATPPHDLRELVVAIVRSPSFAFRAPAAGEVLR
jgi:hypothetical protein